MSTLYELTNEMLELMEWMSDPETDAQAIQDTLEGLMGEISDKAEQYCFVIRQFEADAEAYKKEAERFSQKRAIAENNAKRMKQAVQRAMELTGQEKMDAGLFKLKISKNGGLKPLVIDGEVPAEFVKMVPQQDNDAIRKFLDALDENDTCAWAHYGERGAHLSIK